MLKLDIYKSDGTKSSELDLPSNIFTVKANEQLLAQAVYVHLSNKREGNAHSKDRSEVRGGGKKPWKQKGTGNARAGSSRSPLWTGGGVTFGPRNTKNWKRSLSKKMRKMAILGALTDKLTEKKIILLDNLEFSKVKTSHAQELLQKLPIDKGRILLVLPKNDVKVELSFRNLPYVDIILANSINAYEVLSHDWLIMSKESVEVIEKTHFSKNENIKEQKSKETEEHKNIETNKQVEKKESAKFVVKSAKSVSKVKKKIKK